MRRRRRHSVDALGFEAFAGCFICLGIPKRRTNGEFAAELRHRTVDRNTAMTAICPILPFSVSEPTEINTLNTCKQNIYTFMHCTAPTKSRTLSGAAFFDMYTKGNCPATRRRHSPPFVFGYCACWSDSRSAFEPTTRSS